MAGRKSNLIRVGTLARLIRSTVVPPFPPLFSTVFSRLISGKTRGLALVGQREFYLILPLTEGEDGIFRSFED